MCKLPVTFGGGIGTTYTGRRSAAEASAANTPWRSQKEYQRGSTVAGSYGWSSPGTGSLEGAVIAPSCLARHITKNGD